MLGMVSDMFDRLRYANPPTERTQSTKRIDRNLSTVRFIRYRP